MVVRSLRRHAILVGLVVHATLSAVWAGTIVASVTLLVVVHVRSIIGARVVWVSIWVLSTRLSLWLGRMGLLSLSSLSSLLGLRDWVGGSMSAGLGLTSRSISGLCLLGRRLGEGRGGVGRRSVVSAEGTLLGGWAFLGLCTLLLGVLLAVVVLVRMALLICGVVLRVFARGR